MVKDLKSILAKKLTENSLRHAEAHQEVEVDIGRQHKKLHVELIDANPYQPRSLFAQEEIEALAASIAEVGLLQPISVRATAGERYQLIAGERRLRAHKLLGRPTIEALVIPVEEADMAVLAMVENIDREDLTDYEIGKALRQIETLFPTKSKLAEALGMGREDMYRYYAFELLPEHLRTRLDSNPRLLSRTAAADIKRVLQQSKSPENTLALLDKAWALLENGELDQTKVAAYLQREMHAPRLTRAELPENAAIELACEGRKVGSIVRSRDTLVIKLKAEALTKQQEAQLCTFLEELVNKKSVST